jgi:hypothetical protein
MRKTWAKPSARYDRVGSASTGICGTGLLFEVLIEQEEKKSIAIASNEPSSNSLDQNLYRLLPSRPHKESTTASLINRLLSGGLG